MRPSSFGWLRGVLLASALSVAACSSDNQPGPATCTPACRDGFTCVSGTCVSACNPACSASETCVLQGGAAICVANVSDSGTDVVDATTPDVEQTDVTQPDVPVTDTTPPSDVTPPMDTAPVDGGRPPCGMTGQPCCNSACLGNNVCNATSMRCEAFTPEADECTSNAMCGAGRVCAYGYRCSGETRVCSKCIATPTGLAAGAMCGSMSGPCATGICANSACTITCAPGEAGDALCRSFDAATTCSELSPTYATVDGGRGPLSTFGACIRSCRRDADCPSTSRCGLAQQRVADTLIQTCRVPFESLAAGAACPTMPTSTSDPMMYCQSGQCIPDSDSPTERMGHCSAFCVTDSDCPSVLPHCREFAFQRPSWMVTHGTVPIRMCDR